MAFGSSTGPADVPSAGSTPTFSYRRTKDAASAWLAGWQTIERKAGFIGQIMRASPNGPRTLEPDDEEALAYGQIKALATGDEDFLKLADLEDQLARLERLQRGHHQEQAALGRRQEGIQTEISGTRTALHKLSDWAAKIAAQPDSSDAFPLYVDGRQQENRGDAARAIATKLTRSPVYNMFSVGVGHNQLTARWEPIDHSGRFAIDSADISVVVDDTSHNALIGALTRIVNQVRAVPGRAQNLEHNVLADQLAQLERIETAFGTPFPHTDELRQLRQQTSQLRQTLETRYAVNQDSTIKPETGDASPDNHPRAESTAPDEPRSEPHPPSLRPGVAANLGAAEADLAALQQQRTRRPSPDLELPPPGHEPNNGIDL